MYHKILIAKQHITFKQIFSNSVFRTKNNEYGFEQQDSRKLTFNSTEQENNRNYPGAGTGHASPEVYLEKLHSLCKPVAPIVCKSASIESNHSSINIGPTDAKPTPSRRIDNFGSSTVARPGGKQSKVNRGTRGGPTRGLDSIPGPANLPFVGTSWLYWPWVGPYNRHTFHQADIGLF